MNKSRFTAAEIDARLNSVNGAGVELFPGEDTGHGGYTDFHYEMESGTTTDYTARIIETTRGQLNLENEEGSYRMMHSGNVVVVHNAELTFSSGVATYSDDVITADSTCFVQRRSGAADTGYAFSTHSEDGTLTICGPSSLSATINVNILIFSL